MIFFILWILFWSATGFIFHAFMVSRNKAEQADLMQYVIISAVLGWFLTLLIVMIAVSVAAAAAVFLPIEWLYNTLGIERLSLKLQRWFKTHFP